MDSSGLCSTRVIALRLRLRVGRARRGVGAARPINTLWQRGLFLLRPTWMDRHSVAGLSFKPQFSKFVSRARRGTRPMSCPLKQSRRGPSSRAEGLAVLPSVAASGAQMCGLTLRSRRGPTASHQARRLTLFIIQSSGLASRRRSRLNSNVRQRRGTLVVRKQNQRLPA
jgi:hypothetical protein